MKHFEERCLVVAAFVAALTSAARSGRTLNLPAIPSRGGDNPDNLRKKD
jgi:hypothetical protein